MIWEYHDGFRLAATNIQYPVVPKTRAFFDPNSRTTKEATMEQNMKDTYNIPRDIVPKSWKNQNNSNITTHTHTKKTNLHCVFLRPKTISCLISIFDNSLTDPAAIYVLLSKSINTKCQLRTKKKKNNIHKKFKACFFIYNLLIFPQRKQWE